MSVWPLDPAGTADILLEIDIPTVSGNEDRIIVEMTSDNEISPTLSFVRKELSPLHMRWLESLTPKLVAFDNLFLCHGTPASDHKYLLRSVNASGLIDTSADELDQEVARVEQAVILCGHDHLPGNVRLRDGKLIVNPGSVGLQAYDDDTPFPHVVENGTPNARYCIISRKDDRWTVENVVLAYDWQAAASVAKKNGRADWAHWLTTGRA